MAKARKGTRKAAAKTGNLPTREQLVEFLADNPERNSKREISRAFNVKGNDKVALKALIKDLTDDGIIQKRGKRLMRAGDLPRVLVLDIVARDSGGGLLAKPAAWDESAGKPPTLSIKPQKVGAGAAAGLGDRVLARTERIGDSGIEYTARVMKRLDKKRDVLLGVVRIDGDDIRLEPTQKRQSEMLIERDALNGAEHGDLVEAQTSGSTRHGLKRARVTQVIGSMAGEKAASMIAIHANGIPHIFPEAALQEAQTAKPLEAEGKLSHEDWRDLPLVTIDPADAKDHDDAIHAAPDPENDGGHIVTVAIADVSWYVRPGSALDAEALKRGNSVYFPDRVVPMLPERISNDLCSLRNGVDRPALAVRMWFDAPGKKVRHTFHRIIMRSAASLAYEQAQAAIDGRPDDTARPLVADVLQPLWAAYKCLKQGRAARSPLELDIPERKIELNSDGTVKRIHVPERLDAHKLVEEFMIQANVAAAETLEANKQRLIYRIHDEPSLDKMEALREFLNSMNLPLMRSGNLRASQFNGVLDSVRGHEREELVSQVVLRSQSQAEYAPQNIGHFGLNLMRYAHFTSPIRRYADLIVHRALVAALGLGPGGLTGEQEERLDVIAADISMTERRAMVAERETIDRLVASFLSEKIGATFAGRVNGVTKAGLFVTLAETGADGFVPISTISDEYLVFDEARYALIGEDSGTGYQMGQPVEVKLIEVAPVAGALRFEILSEGIALKKLHRSGPSKGRDAKGRKRSSRRTGKRTRR